MKTLKQIIEEKKALCERMQKNYSPLWFHHYTNGKINAYKEILNLIDQCELEPVDVDDVEWKDCGL